MKLRGRTTTSDRRRLTIFPRICGAKQMTHHGPLQRLSGDQSQPPVSMLMVQPISVVSAIVVLASGVDVSSTVIVSFTVVVSLIVT